MFITKEVDFDAERDTTVVHGISPNLEPYSIELSGPNSLVWYRLLSRSRYKRSTFIQEKKPLNEEIE